MKFTAVQKAFLAIIVANIIWGAAASIFKIALTNIPPFTLAFWRFFLGAMLIGVWLRGKLTLKLEGKRDWTLLVGYALSGITFNIMFFFWGLQLTHSINAPVIASAGPILTLLFAVFFLHERIAAKKVIGLLMGTMGILIIVLQPILAQGLDGSLLGNLSLLLATLGAVFHTIFGKKAFRKFHAHTFTFWAFIVGSASFLPLAVKEFFQSPTLYQTLDWRGYMGIGFGAILSSALAYSWYAWGLSKISASDASMFTYLDPIVGTTLGVIFLHEPLTQVFIVGSILIFVGICVAEGHLVHYPMHQFRGDTPTHSQDNEKSLEHAETLDKRAVLRKIFTKP